MMGHMDFNYLQNMCQDTFVDGIPSKLESEIFNCGTCIRNEIYNLLIKNNRSRTKEILELVRTYLNESHATPGFKDSK